MALKFDPDYGKLPYIELECGHRIRCYGRLTEDQLAQRGESREKVQQQLEVVYERSMRAGFNLRPYETLVLSAVRFYEYDGQKAADVLVATQGIMRRLEINKTAEQLRHVFEEGLVWLAPVREDSGAAAIIVHHGKQWNTAKVSFKDLWAAIYLTVQVVLNDETVHFTSLALILDYDGISMTQTSKMKPKLMKAMIELQQLRLIETTVHSVNTSRLFKAIMEFFAFAQKGCPHKTFIHGTDWASLHQHVSAKCLPPQYGGTAPDYDHGLMASFMRHMQHKTITFGIEA
ncbi:hypothetical protein pipiens_018431 [Culex pipiens pipiens]|uniref:Alpha-tocopherol transfer protein-like n=3 Tax=Culex pipiens TaxID=7175 RepID=A0A8D8H5M3_CULPI